jgi:hypothetical protein
MNMSPSKLPCEEALESWIFSRDLLKWDES